MKFSFFLKKKCQKKCVFVLYLSPLSLFTVLMSVYVGTYLIRVGKEKKKGKSGVKIITADKYLMYIAMYVVRREQGTVFSLDKN